MTDQGQVGIEPSGRRLLIVGSFSLPVPDAAGTRVWNLGRALVTCGWRVNFGGYGGLPVDPSRREDVREETGTMGILPCSPKAGGLLGRAATHLNRGRSLWAVEEWLKGREPDVILCYHGTPEYLVTLKRLATRWQVPLVADVTEWHKGSHMFGGTFGLPHIEQEIRLRLLLGRWRTPIVAISPFLEGHFRERGQKVVRVPPLVDTDEWRFEDGRRRSEGDAVRLLYFGNALRDSRAILVGAVAEAAKELGQVRVQTVGAQDIEGSAEGGEWQVMINRGRLRWGALPRLPRSELRDELGRADAVIMARADARWSRASFPSRIPEALASGTPIVATETEPLRAICNAGFEGIVLTEHSRHALANGIVRVANMEMESRMRLRRAARRTAEVCFDYRRYAEILDAFFKDVISES